MKSHFNKNAQALGIAAAHAPDKAPIGRPKDWFIKVRSTRMTRIEELQNAVDDGVATEADHMELDELRAQRACLAPVLTIEEFKDEDDEEREPDIEDNPYFDTWGMDDE